MAVLNVMTKQILLLLLIFYGLPVFWWTYNDMDKSPENDYFLTVRFLMSTGSLMTAMSVGYMILPFTFIPRTIPIVGGLDDIIAKMIAGGGMMMFYAGYKFGTGEVPREFQMTVTFVAMIYNIMVPFLQDIVWPLLVPAVKAIGIPMNAAASTLMRIVMEKAQDPVTADAVTQAAKETARKVVAAANTGEL